MASVLGQYKTIGKYPKYRTGALPSRDGEQASVPAWKAKWNRTQEKQARRSRRASYNDTSSRRQHEGWREASGQVIDKKFLLDVSHTHKPDEVCAVRVADRNLVAIEPDVAEFKELVHLDCSENFLSLESVAVFPKITVLDMTLNGIVSVAIPPAAFSCLKRLNLSHNSLTHESIVALGTLPVLEALDLSSNELRAMPLEMSGVKLSADENGVPKAIIGFRSLKSLILDDNQLSGATTFQALAGLPELRKLALSRNRLTFVPELSAEAPSVTTADVDDAQDPDSSALAFPRLETLQLTSNQITNSEDLMAIGAWPCLKEVTLFENPITRRTRSGLPRDIVEELVQTRGLNLISSEQKPLKPRLVLDKKSLVTVKTEELRLPRVGDRAQSLLATAKTPYLEYTSHRPQTALPDLDSDTDEYEEGTEGGGFFLTSFDDRGIDEPSSDTSKSIEKSDDFSVEAGEAEAYSVDSLPALATKLSVAADEESVSSAPSTCSTVVLPDIVPEKFKGFEDLYKQDKADIELAEREPPPANVMVATKALRTLLKQSSKTAVKVKRRKSSLTELTLVMWLFRLCTNSSHRENINTSSSP